MGRIGFYRVADRLEKIWGRHGVLQALRSGKRRIARVHLLETGRDTRLDQIEAHARARGIAIFKENRRKLDQLAPAAVHQGVVAFCEPAPENSLEGLWEIAQRKGGFPFFVALDEVEDPANVGAVFRSAEAAGVHGVLLPKRRSAPLEGAVLKASSGALEELPFCRVSNMVEALRALQEKGCWVYGTASEGGRAYFEADFRRPLVLVLGNENRGLRRLVQETCDELLTIPLYGKTPSLNVSAAAAVFFFEIARARRKEGFQGRDTRAFLIGKLCQVLRLRAGGVVSPHGRKEERSDLNRAAFFKRS